MVVATTAVTGVAGIMEIAFSAGAGTRAVTLAGGSPIRLIMRMQTISSTAWFFRKRPKPSSAPRRLLSISSDDWNMKTSAYGTMAFMNLAEALPWEAEGGVARGSRVLLLGCVTWCALIFLLAVYLRFVLWVFWKLRRKRKRQRSFQEMARKRGLDDDDEKIFELSKIPAVLYFPRAELLASTICMIPCTLALVAYGADVQDGEEDIDAFGVAAAACAGVLVAITLRNAVIVARATTVEPTYLVYKKKEEDGGGGCWVSKWYEFGRAASHFAERRAAMFWQLRGPKESRFGRVEIPVYSFLELALLCAATACCAYGGSSPSRRTSCAATAASLMALDAVMVVTIRPMRTPLANVGAAVAATGASAGFLSLAVYFRDTTGDGHLSAGAIVIHMSTLLFLVGVEMMLEFAALRERVDIFLEHRRERMLGKRINEAIARQVSEEMSTTNGTAVLIGSAAEPTDEVEELAEHKVLRHSSSHPIDVGGEDNYNNVDVEFSSFTFAAEKKKKPREHQNLHRLLSRTTSYAFDPNIRQSAEQQVVWGSSSTYLSSGSRQPPPASPSYSGGERSSSRRHDWRTTTTDDVVVITTVRSDNGLV